MPKTTLLAAAATLAFVGAAAAAELSPTDIVHGHMGFAAKGDFDSLANDYAEYALTISNGNVTVGRAAIMAQFAKMFGPRPGAKPGAGGGMGAMKVIKVWHDGPVGLVSWESGPVKGTDACVVRHGKIESQSVFMHGGPPPAPALSDINARCHRSVLVMAQNLH